MTTINRSVAAAVVAAPIAYIMFDGSEQPTRIAVSAIFAVTAGVFAALFFGSSAD